MVFLLHPTVLHDRHCCPFLTALCLAGCQEASGSFQHVKRRMDDSQTNAASGRLGLGHGWDVLVGETSLPSRVRLRALCTRKVLAGIATGR